MQILLFFALIIIALVFNALLLYITTKILKVNKANYKTSLLISIIQLITIIIIVIIVKMILSALNIGDISTFLAIIFGFVIFHKLLRTYYQTTLKKNIVIYIIFTIITVVISLMIIIPTRNLVIQPFYVAGNSMNPTYQDGDYIMLKKYDKTFRRGDVIVFTNPQASNEFIIQRIIGLPGEKIQIKDGFVYLYNSENPNGKKIEEPYLEPNTETNAPNKNIVDIGSNNYYTLSDNRTSLKDSRNIGPISIDLIVGKVWFKAGEK